MHAPLAPPLPQLPPRSVNPQGRPGELREALRLTAETAQRLAAAANEARLGPDLAFALLLEASLVCAWRPEAAEVDAVLGEPPELAMSAAEGDYLRALMMRPAGPKAGRTPAAPELVSVPVRLISRADAVVVSRAVESNLEQAIGWEVAALRDGLTMGEWVARRLLDRLAAERGGV